MRWCIAGERMTGGQWNGHYRLRKDRKSSHQQIARLLKEARRGLVLDVGAAQGILGRLMGDLQFAICDLQLGEKLKIEIDAIEPNAEWAEAARPFYRRGMSDRKEDGVVGVGGLGFLGCVGVM